jgi:hypothetical protein
MLPTDMRGVARVDARRANAGIGHVPIRAERWVGRAGDREVGRPSPGLTHHRGGVYQGVAAIAIVGRH